jgi:predicted peroxiredoxin
MSERIFFGNLTTDNAMKASKIIRMLIQMEDRGVKTTLFLNINGVKIADKTNYVEKCPVTGKAITDLLKSYMAKNGKILIGPDCMKLAGVNKDSILDGITIITDPDILFNVLLNENLTIISYS